MRLTTIDNRKSDHRTPSLPDELRSCLSLDGARLSRHQAPCGWERKRCRQRLSWDDGSAPRGGSATGGVA